MYSITERERSVALLILVQIIDHRRTESLSTFYHILNSLVKDQSGPKKTPPWPKRTFTRTSSHAESLTLNTDLERVHNKGSKRNTSIRKHGLAFLIRSRRWQHILFSRNKTKNPSPTTAHMNNPSPPQPIPPHCCTALVLHAWQPGNHHQLKSKQKLRPDSISCRCTAFSA